jgi:hypothetical protein
MVSFIRFEGRGERVARRAVFLRRLGRNLGLALAVIAVSLVVGMAGFMIFEGKGLSSAYDNAAMILSGMGPFDEADSDAGRIFEGTYALYSGLVVILVSTLVLAPVFHRVLHSFHVEDEDDEKRAERPKGRRGG